MDTEDPNILEEPFPDKNTRRTNQLTLFLNNWKQFSIRFKGLFWA